MTLEYIRKNTDDALLSVLMGADVAVQLSTRILIVPEVRLHGLASGGWLPIMRPGVRMRVKL